MQCIKKFCSKINEIYTQCMHFKGFSCPKKHLLPGLRPVTGFFTRSPPLFSGFCLNFWPLGASSPFVTLISGYAYVGVSNNKQ